MMMMGSSSSFHTVPPAPKSKRDWKDDSTALLMDLFEETFLANSMNILTQQHWKEILLRIEEHSSAYLGSSSVQSTQNAEEI